MASSYTNQLKLIFRTNQLAGFFMSGKLFFVGQNIFNYQIVPSQPRKYPEKVSC